MCDDFHDFALKKESKMTDVKTLLWEITAFTSSVTKTITSECIKLKKNTNPVAVRGLQRDDETRIGAEAAADLVTLGQARVRLE